MMATFRKGREMVRHLDEIVHDIKVEATYLEGIVDIDEICDMEQFDRHVTAIENHVALLRRKAK